MTEKNLFIIYEYQEINPWLTRIGLTLDVLAEERYYACREKCATVYRCFKLIILNFVPKISLLISEKNKLLSIKNVARTNIIKIFT